MLMVPAFIPANGAVETAITIAVMVIAFIGWLVQLANQKAKPPGPINRPQPIGQRPPAAPVNRPQARPRDERLQSEIDTFLREVATGRKAPPQEVEEDAIEVIEDDEPQHPFRRVTPAAAAATTTAQAPAPAGQVSDWDREQQRRRERLLSTLGERHIESTPLGAELRKHVEQYMHESVQLRKEKDQVERRLAEAHAEIRAMRAQTAASPGAAPVTAGGSKSQVAALLKNRRSVKDAIVINEVLGRPKGLRRSQ
jgi:regulator of replication initiation timing